MAKRPTKSITGPIVLASVAVALSIVVLVGWIWVILQKREVLEGPPGIWLLVLGILSLAFIIVSQVLFSVFLVREILEVRRQTTFIDSVTHELKSPLASLRLCLETLRRADVSDAQRQQLHTMMLSDIERLNVFIDDVLMASRAWYRRRTYTVSEVPLAAMAHRCVEGVQRRYKLQGDELHIDIPDDLVLLTDDTVLETVLKNLIDNAVKYSGDRVDVRVRATRTLKGRVRLEVIDRGIGIPAKDRKRIFDRFYRVKDEAVRARPGTGLGLYVVSVLIRSLGGSLRADSEGPGRGTTMTVLVPERTRKPVTAEASA